MNPPQTVTSDRTPATMLKHNAANERAKRLYFAFLKEAVGQNEATIDAVAKALARFELDTDFRDFKAFHYEEAVAFKRRLYPTATPWLCFDMERDAQQQQSVAGASFTKRAGDRTRTGDVQLGKLAFYQLNYARVRSTYPTREGASTNSGQFSIAKSRTRDYIRVKRDTRCDAWTSSERLWGLPNC